MNLKELFTEDRAVSPVIGVILMVAITVILAAVIGTFVLGLGDSVQQTTPSASFSFDYDREQPDPWQGDVSVTHEGGDSIEADRLAINVGGNVTEAEDFNNWEGTVSAGDTETLTFDGDDLSEGDRVRVIWTSQDGSSSSTIGNSQLP